MGAPDPGPTASKQAPLLTNVGKKGFVRLKAFLHIFDILKSRSASMTAILVLGVVPFQGLVT